MGVNRHVGYSSHKSHSAVTCAYCIFIYFVQLDVLGVTRSRRGSFHPARWKLHGVSLVLEKKESGLHPMTPVRIPPTHLLVRPPISAQSEAESRPDITMADPCSRCPFIRYPRRTKYIQLTQNRKGSTSFSCIGLRRDEPQRRAAAYIVQNSAAPSPPLLHCSTVTAQPDRRRGA